jgi:hypothetical protein
LTNQPTFSEYYRRLVSTVEGAILQESDEQIVGSSTDDLKSFYYDRNAVSEIVEDEERDACVDIQDYIKTIHAHERDAMYRYDGDLPNYKCQRAILEVPIHPNKDLNEISRRRTETFSSNYLDREFQWEHTRIKYCFETKGYGVNMTEDQIAQHVEQALNRIRQVILEKNACISNGNGTLSAAITKTIEDRKKIIAENAERINSLTKKLSIPLKKKDVIGARTISLTQKPIVQRLKPNPKLPEEYVLDESRVKDIIEFIDGQAKNYEQTPNAIKNLGEEDLRDLLLANLNSIFQGDATGETFSKNGKTDIYLKIAKGNILICECKIWGGKALYGATIDQLRGYLTWRHNYGIMITFVRIKSFTKVLSEAEQAIKLHPSYLNGFQKRADTHFVSVHKVDDDDKEVKIHHLFYHLA